MEECVICQTPIDNKTYAFINNDHERGVYRKIERFFSLEKR
jgi:hypothetical protein